MDEFDDYFAYLEVVEENELVDRLPKRYIRGVPSPFNFYSEIEFKCRDRFSKNTVADVILPLVSEGYIIQNNRGLPVSPINQLFVALTLFGTAEFQLVAGDIHHFSQGCISTIIKKVAIKLAENLGQYVHFPVTENEQRVNIMKFYEMYQFPCVAGCVDCTHIPIQYPGGENGEVFRNRKRYFSINVQVIAGPRMEIMDIVVRHPGLTHDSVIFDRSSARVQFERRDVTGLLVGDNGYACRPYLLTPLINPANQQEKNYNRTHKSTRNIVERAFGLWKRRFACLSRLLRTKLETTVAIICACAALHNIRINQNEEVDFAEPAPEEMQVNNNLIVHNIGLEFRRQFIIQHF